MKVSVVLVLALASPIVAAFIPRLVATPRTTGSDGGAVVIRKRSELYEVIRGDTLDTPTFDVGAGGVRLAKENAIKITAEVRHKPGSAESRALDLKRYTQLSKIEESQIKDILSKSGGGGKIIATGMGVELYKDPGDSLESIVKLAPMEAIKDAVNGAASAIKEKKLVINFLGGDDLIVGEVLDATNELVVMMDIATKAKVSVNSLSHNSIPMGTCSVCVVSLGEASSELTGVEESVAAGEVYYRDGVWYTVDK